MAAERNTLVNRLVFVSTSGYGINSKIHQHHVWLHQDSTLADVLEILETGAKVPPELYLAVTEILVFVYRMSHKYMPPCNPST